MPWGGQSFSGAAGAVFLLLVELVSQSQLVVEDLVDRVGSTRLEAVRIELRLEIAQPFNRRGCRLEGIKGEIQLLAVRHRGQQVNGRRRRLPS